MRRCTPPRPFSHNSHSIPGGSGQPLPGLPRSSPPSGKRKDAGLLWTIFHCRFLPEVLQVIAGPLTKIDLIQPRMNMDIQLFSGRQRLRRFNGSFQRTGIKWLRWMYPPIPLPAAAPGPAPSHSNERRGSAPLTYRSFTQSFSPCRTNRKNRHLFLLKLPSSSPPELWPELSRQRRTRSFHLSFIALVGGLEKNVLAQHGRR